MPWSVLYWKRYTMTATRTPRTRAPVKGVPPVPPPAVQKPAPEPDTSTPDILLAAIAVFDGGKNSFTSRSGKEVVIRPAAMAHLAPCMHFFAGVVSALDPNDLAQLIDAIVYRQKQAIAQGEDPNNINLRELSSLELVSKASSHVNIFASLMAGVFHLLPTLVPTFTNLTEAEYSAMELDEGMLVAGGIFLLNYRFFTQSLPPMLTVFMRSWASKKGVTAPSTDKAKGTKSTK